MSHQRVETNGLKFLKNNAIRDDSQECIIIVKFQYPEVFKGSFTWGIFLFVTAIYLHVILWNYSHGAMGVDVICYVYIYIYWNHGITQNGYGTYSCATSHTEMHYT